MSTITGILYYRLHANARGATEIDPTVAIQRLEAVREKLQEAMAHPTCRPGKLLRDTGFCSIILMDPQNQVLHVEKFQEGLCAVITDSGDQAVVTAELPEENSKAAMTWLADAIFYCNWCRLVQMAAAARVRPPALSLLFHKKSLEQWVGTSAHAYVTEWKKTTYGEASELTKAAVTA